MTNIIKEEYTSGCHEKKRASPAARAGGMGGAAISLVSLTGSSYHDLASNFFSRYTNASPRSSSVFTTTSRGSTSSSKHDAYPVDAKLYARHCCRCRRRSRRDDDADVVVVAGDEHGAATDAAAADRGRTEARAEEEERPRRRAEVAAAEAAARRRATMEEGTVARIMIFYFRLICTCFVAALSSYGTWGRWKRI